ncbi:transposase [Escherichia coli]
MIDVLGPEKRRRRTTQEKIAIVQQSFEPGMTVSLVARQHGVAASQLFLSVKQSGRKSYCCRRRRTGCSCL